MDFRDNHAVILSIAAIIAPSAGVPPLDGIGMATPGISFIGAGVACCAWTGEPVPRTASVATAKAVDLKNCIMGGLLLVVGSLHRCETSLGGLAGDGVGAELPDGLLQVVERHVKTEEGWWATASVAANLVYDPYQAGLT